MVSEQVINPSKKTGSCLVTGGAGFIGSHVVDDLLKQGHEVVALDDLSGGYEDNVHNDATFVKGSITDHELLEKLFEEHKFDYVFHLGAYAAEGLSHFIRRFNYENNLLGSMNLINLAILHKVKCFVFTSSIAVYGKNQLPMTEDTTPQPEDPYGISKYAVELDLQSAHDMFGLNYVIFRPHNVYGERQNIGDRYRNVIGIFMNQIMLGEPLTIFGDGTQTRAFTHIDDVAPIIANSINVKRAYNQVFNVGADEPYSVNELVEVIAAEFGKEVTVHKHPARNEVKHAYSAHQKVKDIFGVKDSISLQEGVKRMAAWAKEHGARETPKFENIEIHEKLPPVWKNKE